MFLFSNKKQDSKYKGERKHGSKLGNEHNSKHGSKYIVASFKVAKSNVLSEQGQASIEAAFLLPIFFLVFGLFLQPAFLLYNRCVMHAAAAESCRMLASATTDENSKKAYVLRRLSAIPCLSAFHEGDVKNYEITFSGGQMSEEVSVKIVNRAKPLPLLGVSAGLAGQMEGSSIKQEVFVSAHVTPAWASNAGSPSSWISKWK